MHKNSISKFTLGALLVISGAAHAHHGQDFLLLQDAFSPLPFHGSIYAGVDWERTGGEDEFGTEAGVQVGILPRLSAGATLEFSDEGDGWDYASVMPFLHLNLTPKDLGFPVRFAVMGGYQFANNAGDSEAHGHEEEEAGHHEEGEAEEAGEGHHHEEEAEGGHEHSHGGIHRHDENFFLLRFIVEADLTSQDKLVLNLISLLPESGRPAWGYAAGLRHSFNHEWAVGLEAQGDFGEANEHELVLGGYFSPIHTVTLKLGVGAGLTEESPDFTVRTGLVWRF